MPGFFRPSHRTGRTFSAQNFQADNNVHSMGSAEQKAAERIHTMETFFRTSFIAADVAFF